MSRVTEWFDSASEHTATASSIVRQIAIAGVGAVWVFRTADEAAPFRVPLALIFLSLFLDVLQYVWLGLAHYRLARRHEVARTEGDLRTPNWIARVAFLIWGTKILTVLAATGLLFAYLISTPA